MIIMILLNSVLGFEMGPQSWILGLTRKIDTAYCSSSLQLFTILEEKKSDHSCFCLHEIDTTILIQRYLKAANIKDDYIYV